jgi:LPXTG-motif cell wall-anchored protein
VSCSPLPSDGNDCVVMQGGFQVYTRGSASDNGLDDALSGQVRGAMNSGKFNDGVHPEIVDIKYVELSADRSPDDSNAPNPNQVRSAGATANTAVIIGASVGALLVLGALVFYRRRQKTDDAGEDFLQPAGGSSA